MKYPQLNAAVEARFVQLRRQINTQTNPMIKEILETEIRELRKEMDEATTLANQPKK